jgi:hypothetical protein
VSSARARTSAFGVAAFAVAAAVIASAHHSAAATYAADESLVVQGRVSGFAWTNPHCHVYVDVTAGAFMGRTYTVELSSPGALAREGWAPATLKAGDVVVMTVHPSRAGDPIGLCRQCAVSVNGTPMYPRASST